MLSSTLAAVISFLVSATATPAMRWAAKRVGAIDHPGLRRVHRGVVPRLGGVAIAAAFFAALVPLALYSTATSQLLTKDPTRVWGFVLGSLVLLVVGAIDDVRALRATTKLVAQVGAAGIAYAAGFRIDILALPFVGTVELGLLTPIVSVLWITGIVNALNLIDGLDGLAAGIGFFVCVTNITVGVFNSDPQLVLLSTALAGALLGFLIYNFNPATIFMGDSGSMFLGFTLATTSMLIGRTKSPTTVALLAPLLALGLPIIDTLFAMVRRLLERRPLFSPDRGHIHHLLLGLGLTHRRAVLALYSLCFALSMAAIAVSARRDWQIGAAVAGLGLTVFVMLRTMLPVWMLSRLRTARRSPSLEAMCRSIPRYIATLQQAANPEAAFDTTRRFARDAGIMEVSLLPLSESENAPNFRWNNEAADLPIGRARTARFNLQWADTSCELSLSYDCDSNATASLVETQLMIVAAALDQHLSGLQPARRRAPASGTPVQSRAAV